MDAIKILGSLLNSGVLTKGGSSNDILGSLIGAALGGSKSQPTQGGGSLGDLFGSLLGGSSGGSTSGGIGDLMGGLLGGKKASSGGLGDMLGSVLGGGSKGAAVPTDAKGLEDLLGIGKSTGGGLGGLLGGALAKYGQVNNPNMSTPSSDDHNMLPRGIDPHEATMQAELMIKAMINAAKSDGSLDDAEQEKILSKLGDISQDEVDFIRAEFARPLNVQGFANEVPRGMEHQVYMISLSAIDLDENSEARYLGELAQALRINPSEANQIHAQLGAPQIFA